MLTIATPNVHKGIRADHLLPRRNTGRKAVKRGLKIRHFLTTGAKGRIPHCIAKQHQASGAKLIELPDWKLFFLHREGVLKLEHGITVRDGVTIDVAR
jgi:hypothetical protein